MCLFVCITDLLKLGRLVAQGRTRQTLDLDGSDLCGLTYVAGNLILRLIVNLFLN